MEQRTARRPRLVFLTGLISGVVLTLGWRALHPEAQAQEPKMPFASSVEQRQQTVEEIRKLSALMQKQMDLLVSGRVRVVVVDERSDGARRRSE